MLHYAQVRKHNKYNVYKYGKVSRLAVKISTM